MSNGTLGFGLGNGIDDLPFLDRRDLSPESQVRLPDTIFARASSAGKAGVAVFRLSGPRAFAIAKVLCGTLPAIRSVALRQIRDGPGELIDTGLVIPFAGPGSFTGENVVELHLHGSAAVEAALYEALVALGARPAEAGEFTRRALVNGRLDLAEVEGLADLLDAETSLQRKQALGQLGGRLSAVAEGWRGRLLRILTALEADIDFPDEAGVPAAIAARAGPEIDALIGELQLNRQASARARTIRRGLTVAIIGAPNAGKSSLLNRLAGSERAIVSDLPGTTRDFIEVRLDLGGALVTLIDTAGLRDVAGDDLEAEGMRRTRMKAQEADLRFLVIDVSRETQEEGISREKVLEPARAGDFVVLNKIDLDAPWPNLKAQGLKVVPVSAKTGAGMTVLLGELAIAAGQGGAEEGVLTRERHAIAVDGAIVALKRSRDRISAAPELAAEDVRLAARALGEITGAVGAEAVLGEIFSSFCIGK